jgi:hypothetical protein
VGSYLLRAGAIQRAIDATATTRDHADRLLGTDHPDTLTTRAQLAYAYRSVGRVSDAEALDAQSGDEPGGAADRS